MKINLKKEHKEILLSALFLLCFTTILIFIGLAAKKHERDELAKYRVEKICKVLKAKHMENESLNFRGDFRVVHYFLYEDNTLGEVDLNDYMKYEIGQSICWYVNVKK